MFHVKQYIYILSRQHVKSSTLTTHTNIITTIKRYFILSLIPPFKNRPIKSVNIYTHKPQLIKMLLLIHSIIIYKNYTNIFTKHISLFHVKHLNYKIYYYTQTKTHLSSQSIIVIIKRRILKYYPYTPTNDS